MRAVYVDLDGTLLGRRASLFADGEGQFSLASARALQACDRAGIEVVLMSGRREAQVHEDARMIGQTSYVCETGCLVVVDGEQTLVTGSWRPGDRTVHEQIDDSGAPAMLLDAYADRLEYHEPWHVGRQFSHLFRGAVDAGEATEMLAEAGHELVLVDNGRIGRTMPGLEVVHTFHLLPLGAGKAEGVTAHMRMRGYAPEETIACGDSLEDVGVAAAVGRYFCVANGAAKDPAVATAVARAPNAEVTEGAHGEGVYEAVVGTLARRGG